MADVEQSITFDDVLIVPNYSEIDSRENIDTSTSFLGMTLSVPIVPANMDYITGPAMVRAMYELGSFGILHRFAPETEIMTWMEELDKDNVPFFFSLGIRDIEQSMRMAEYAEDIPNCVGVCIDVAHGHHKKVGELVERVRERTSLLVIAGNVATGAGAKFLISSGANAIKVGIGAGSVCTTRTVAGVGVPQLMAIIDVAGTTDTPFIADGGIRNSGDILKALIGGATIVMAGSLFAGTKECPSPTIIGSDGHKYRPFRGQSIFGVNGERYIKEGIEGYVEDKGPVSDVLYILKAGLRSGMSYIGAASIPEIVEKGRLTIISPSTHEENRTRVRTII